MIEDVLSTVITVGVAAGAIAALRVSKPVQAGGGEQETFTNFDTWKVFVANYYSVPGSSALEVGCGAMKHYYGFRKFANVLGVDLGAQLRRVVQPARDDRRFVFSDSWGDKKHEVIFFLNTLHHVWSDGVADKIASSLLAGGFLVVCVKKVSPVTVRDNEGRVVFEVKLERDGKLQVLRRLDGREIRTLEAAVPLQKLITQLSGRHVVLAHKTAMWWPGMNRVEREVAAAHDIYVFTKKLPSVASIRSAYQENMITEFRFPGGISFNEYMIRDQRPAPAWLLRIADVDTHCTCTETQRRGLFDSLRRNGIAMTTSGKEVGRYVIYTGASGDVELGITAKHDNLHDLLAADDSTGLMTGQAVKDETAMFLYLSFAALVLKGKHSNTRAFKIDKLAARMSAITGAYNAYRDDIEQLRSSFQRHLAEHRDYDWRAAQAFYAKHSDVIDRIVSAVFKDVDLDALESNLRTYLRHTLDLVNFRIVNKRLRTAAQGGGLVRHEDAVQQYTRPQRYVSNPYHERRAALPSRVPAAAADVITLHEGLIASSESPWDAVIGILVAQNMFEAVLLEVPDDFSLPERSETAPDRTRDDYTFIPRPPDLVDI